MIENTHNLVVDQGTDLTITVELYQTDGVTPLPLTIQHTAALMVRKTYGNSTALITANTTNGKLTIDIPNSKIMWNISHTDTQGLKFEGDNDTLDTVYDLELTDGSGKVTRILNGVVTIYREVTR